MPIPRYPTRSRRRSRQRCLGHHTSPATRAGTPRALASPTLPANRDQRQGTIAPATKGARKPRQSHHHHRLHSHSQHNNRLLQNTIKVATTMCLRTQDKAMSPVGIPSRQRLQSMTPTEQAIRRTDWGMVICMVTDTETTKLTRRLAGILVFFSFPFSFFPPLFFPSFPSPSSSLAHILTLTPEGQIMRNAYPFCSFFFSFLILSLFLLLFFPS